MTSSECIILKFDGSILSSINSNGDFLNELMFTLTKSITYRINFEHAGEDLIRLRESTDDHILDGESEGLPNSSTLITKLNKLIGCKVQFAKADRSGSMIILFNNNQNIKIEPIPHSGWHLYQLNNGQIDGKLAAHGIGGLGTFVSGARPLLL